MPYTIGTLNECMAEIRLLKMGLNVKKFKQINHLIKNNVNVTGIFRIYRFDAC